MLARASGLVRVVPRLSRGLPMTRCMGGGTPAHWKSEVEIDTANKTTVDFLPVPQNSWQEHYNRRNTKWNLMVAGSGLFLTLTIFVLYKFDCFYLHGQPNYKNIKIEEY